MLAMGGCGGADASKLSPSESVAKGWVSFRIGEFDIAIDWFDRAIAVGESDAAIEATYGKAMSQMLGHPENGTDGPTKLFYEVAQKSPKSDWAAWSLLAVARSVQKAATAGDGKPDWTATREAYQAVIDKFPEHPAGHEALMMLMGTLLIDGEKESCEKALATLKQFVDSHPTGNTTVIGLDLMADCYQNLAMPQEEVDTRIRSMELRQQQAIEKHLDVSGSYWSIATRAEFELGDFQTARKYYRKLIDEYPADTRVWGAKLALERMDKLEADLKKQVGVAGGHGEQAAMAEGVAR